MQTISNIAQLEALYDDAVPASLTKVICKITPLYRRWIEASRFVILSSVGEDGTDGSPRGDAGPVAKIVGETKLWLPDWRGNNRLDSLRNIVTDGRVSLMFMVPGSKNVVRINGHAVLTSDAEVTNSFEQKGHHPKTVIIISVGEIYFQCAKAILRSRIWSGEDESASVPTAGQFVRDVDADFDAEAYDTGYVENAKDRMW